MSTWFKISIISISVLLASNLSVIVPKLRSSNSSFKISASKAAQILVSRSASLESTQSNFLISEPLSSFNLTFLDSRPNETLVEPSSTAVPLPLARHTHSDVHDGEGFARMPEPMKRQKLDKYGAFERNPLSTQSSGPLRSSRKSPRRSGGDYSLNRPVPVLGNTTGNIAFIKLMKVGGSTLQLVLYRYAAEHGLSLARAKDRRPYSRNVAAHHITLQNFLKVPLVADPHFITVVRNPLEHAVSLFYWNWGGKGFRLERPGNFSDMHLRYLWAYAQGTGTPVEDGHKRVVVRHNPQWSWFGNTPEQAVRSLTTLDMTVCLTERLDECMLVLRRRMRWTVRQILYVSINHHRHLTPADWPGDIAAAMNATLAPDWALHAAAAAAWARQAQAYEEERLASDTESFRALRGALLAACGGEATENHGRGEYVPPCRQKPGQPECRQDKAVIKCMLRVHDACLGPTQPVTTAEETSAAALEPGAGAASSAAADPEMLMPDGVTEGVCADVQRLLTLLNQ